MHQILFIHEDHTNRMRLSSAPGRRTACAAPLKQSRWMRSPRCPFFNQMVDLPKNSISSALNTGLNDWLDGHKRVNTFYRGRRLH